MSSGRENLAGNVAGRPRMPSFISGKTQIERLFTEPARIHKQKACAATYTAAAHAFVRRSVTEEGYPPLRRRRGSGRPTASTVPRRCGLCQAAAYTRGIAQCRRRSSGATHRQAASCGKAGSRRSSQPALVSWLSREAGSTRIPIEETSNAHSRTGFQNRMSPLSAQSS